MNMFLFAKTFLDSTKYGRLFWEMPHLNKEFIN